MKENKKTNISISSLIFGITLFLVIISGVTFSIYGWETLSDEWTNIAFLIENQDQGYTCFADGGGDIVPGEVVIVPATCDSNNAIVREITAGVEFESDNINSVNMDLWLDVNNLATPLSESENFKYVITDSATSCTEGIITSGSFNGKESGDKVDLVSSTFSEDETKKYYLYIWLDEAETDVATANQSFDISLNGTCGMQSATVNLDFQGGSLFENIEYSEPGEYVFTAPCDGQYQLEVWGAQGGDTEKIVGGYGGYSKGEINLNNASKLYVNVGGKGTGSNASGTFTTGGYNGGGSANYGGGTGGGATHVATSSGLLSTLGSNVDSILIVAGGGGGSGVYNASLTGGAGGGMVGVSGGNLDSWLGGGTGGTQTDGGNFGDGTTSGTVGLFGIGGSGGYEANYSHGSGAGGGGLYGGGGGSARNGGGGGGSGYIGNSLLTDKYMYCYNCSTSSDVNTLTYSTTNVSGDAISNYAKSGDGAVRISLDNSGLNTKNVVSGQMYGEFPDVNKDRHFFLGWNTKSDGTGIYITSDTVVGETAIDTLYAIWEAYPEYTISYDANGGSGAPEPQIKVYSETIQLSDVKPIRDGYIFVGWGLTNNDTSATYQAGGEYTSNEDITLYAIWREFNVGDMITSYSCANTTLGNTPYFTYTGDCTVVDDGDGNWRIKFLSDGDFTSTLDFMIDVFAVGGGGNGANTGGGGGGYTKTVKEKSVTAGTTYSIVVGEATQASSGFGVTANGGSSASKFVGGSGGSGGGGGAGSNSAGKGGSDGGNGGSGEGGSGGTGQGTTTREFGETTGDLYAGGGGGGGVTGSSGGAGGGANGASNGAVGNSAVANTGGGGGGGGVTCPYYCFYSAGGSGGSGIVVIRNARYLTVSYDANGGINAPESQTATYGDTIIINSEPASREGYEFLGWSTSSTATSAEYHLNDEYVITSTGTLYAVWKENNFSSFEYTCRNNSLGSAPYDIEYAGDCTVIDDGDGNWRVKFLTSGDFTSTSDLLIDVFAVGGGGNGANTGGGGGGYTKTVKEKSVTAGTTYSIVVGEATQASSGFGVTANGGSSASKFVGGSGGSGGGGGAGSNSAGKGGSDGGNGGSGEGGSGGTGQGTTTREFGETTGDLYAGGGGGGGVTGSSGGAGGGANGASNGAIGNSAIANTGGGGGGGGVTCPYYCFYSDGGSGGSGIVVIRNSR